MTNTITVRFGAEFFGDNPQEVAPGITTGEALRAGGYIDNTPSPVIAALVNNDLTSLSYPIEVSSLILPVTLNSPEGVRVYRRSLCFLLAIATSAVLPDTHMVIGHSIGDGYYYYFRNRERISDDELERIEAEMHRLVRADLPIERTVLSYSNALEHFQACGMTDTATLLEHRNHAKVAVYRCGDYLDISHGPLAPATGMLRSFELLAYKNGFLLRYPPEQDPDALQPFEDNPLLFSIYQEYRRWGEVLGIGSAGQLNRRTVEGNIKQFIWIAEALHNKKIDAIAEQIAEQSNRVRLIAIAGPSSSGKTTFAKKLAIQLRVYGLHPIPISLDDYFVPRDQTPLDEHGNYDFESLAAIDVELLNRHLVALFDGSEIQVPEFDFRAGTRRITERRLRLCDTEILILEGIHGLNDALLPLIPEHTKYRVYVSALTQLNIDDHTRISTTDNRLIRRLVRDHQFRGHSALDTLRMWPSVRRGENRNIFPFQNSADVAFNSALDYELGVLKSHAVRILLGVKPHHEVYHEATRLQAFLENFIEIPEKHVPETSILREFVGDSGFKY